MRGARPHPGRVRPRRRDGRAGRGAGHGPARAAAEELLDQEPGRHGPALFDQGPRQVLRARGQGHRLGAPEQQARRRRRDGHGPARASAWPRASGPGAGVPGTLADLVLYPDGSRRGRLRHAGHRHAARGPTWPSSPPRRSGSSPRTSRSRSAIPTYPWAPHLGRQPDDAVRGPGRARRRPQGGRAAQGARGGPAQGRGRRRRHGRQEVLRRRAIRPSRPPSPRSTATCAGRRSSTASAAGMPDDRFAFNTFGAHFAEVEVDVETGRIRVLKYVAAQDSGRVVNRLDGREPGRRRRHPGPERRRSSKSGSWTTPPGPSSTRTCATTRSRRRSTSPRSRPFSSTSSTRGSTTSA